MQLHFYLRNSRANFIELPTGEYATTVQAADAYLRVAQLRRSGHLGHVVNVCHWFLSGNGGAIEARSEAALTLLFSGMNVARRRFFGDLLLCTMKVRVDRGYDAQLIGFWYTSSNSNHRTGESGIVVTSRFIEAGEDCEKQIFLVSSTM